MDNRERLVKQLFIGMVSDMIGYEKTFELLKEANEAFHENKTDPKKAGLTFKEFQQMANEFSDKINKIKDFPETKFAFIPFTAESMFNSVAGLNESAGEMQSLIDWANNFSKTSREDINSTFDILRSLSSLNLKKGSFEDQLRSIKEAKLTINLFQNLKETEFELSKYLPKKVIDKIKEKTPDKFKCLIELKRELKFLVDRYGKI